VTGFSGTYLPFEEDSFSTGAEIWYETFIDPNGKTVRIYLPDQPAFVWDARLWDLRSYHDVTASEIGQVFGTAIDRGWPNVAGQERNPANVYVTASSAFGLNIVSPDQDGDGLPVRLKFGQNNARFMDWQFGSLAGHGSAAGQFSSPGSIYKIDGRTKEVSLFANVSLFGEANSGPGLGNIAFDSDHDQLFVSDLDTGFIHRFDLDGFDLEQFDHGVTGRPNDGLASAPFDPSNRLDITNFQFDAEDPDTWAFAHSVRRVWGLAVHNKRLYYGVADGPQIWSIGIDEVSGGFKGDARWELDVWADGPDDEVSDIVFNPAGAMILAQRGERVTSYDYTAFTKPRRARVYRYWREDPDDPTSDSRWQIEPQEYAVGFQPNYRNGAGGIDLNYGYDDQGLMDTDDCNGTLWSTGGSLRVNQQLGEFLSATGALVVHGIQGSPAGPVRSFNAPPWSSYFVDFDKKFNDPQATGHLGDVEAYNPCRGGRIPPPPPPPPPPPGGICMEIEADYFCNPAKGEMDVTITVNEGGSGLGADILKVLSQNANATVIGGPFHSLNPANFFVNMPAPTTSATLSLCAFNSAEAQSGKPFTCCRAEVDIKAPRGGCKKIILNIIESDN
jgi:hypothetical protein